MRFVSELFLIRISAPMTDTSNKHIHQLAGQIEDAGNQIGKAWEPEVDQIIREKSKDEDRIERALDYILTGAFHEETLQVFKKLCRYYYTINPSATVRHINYYREMWNSEDLD